MQETRDLPVGRQVRLIPAKTKILPIEQDFFFLLLLPKVYLENYLSKVCLCFRISAATSLSPGRELASSC